MNKAVYTLRRQKSAETPRHFGKFSCMSVVREKILLVGVTLLRISGYIQGGGKKVKKASDTLRIFPVCQ